LQHKLSKRQIDESRAICMEAPKVKGMLENRRLAGPVADAAWGGLVRRLACKAAWSGKHLVQMDQRYASSRTCSCRGSKIESLSLSMRRWTCPACGAGHDRDINAARNIGQKAC